MNELTAWADGYIEALNYEQAVFAALEVGDLVIKRVWKE